MVPPQTSNGTNAVHNVFFFSKNKPMPPKTYTTTTDPQSHATTGIPTIKRIVLSQEDFRKEQTHKPATAIHRATAPDQ